MKYAFLLGSNVFIVPGNTISFTDQEQPHQFLRILHVQGRRGDAETVLTIDADIQDYQGNAIRINANECELPEGYHLLRQPDRVEVSKPSGEAILDVHQLSEQAAAALEHNIIAELEVHAPVAVIRLRGNFMVGALHIEIDNEKLFVGDDSYGNSALAGHGSLTFSEKGPRL